MTLSSHETECLNFRIHYVEEKPKDPEKLLILLHGFPQHWYAWKEYLPRFSQRGFHVVAPDMRGYNASGKPQRKSCYDIRYLVHDILELIHHLGYEKATVMGHDWGGIITWELAEQHPDKLDAAIIVNAPHRGIFAQKLRTSLSFSLRQMVRSWYILFFQFPYLPERLIQYNDYTWLEKGFRSLATKADAFTDEDMEAYKTALQKPGALTASINYYRTNASGHFGKDILRAATGKKKFKKIPIPTLLLWGDQDPPLDVHLTDHTEQYITGPYQEVHFKNASHWVLHEYPQRIMEEIDQFFSRIYPEH